MLNYFGYSRLSLDFQKDIAFLLIITAIFGGLLMPLFSFDFASTSATLEEGEDTGGGGDDGGGDNGEGGGEPDPEPEPEPEPNPDPGFVGDPCEENPEAEGCAPEPPVDPCIEDPTAAGCEPIPPPPGCSCEPGEGQECPDVECPPLDLIGPTPPPTPPQTPIPTPPPSPPPDGGCHPSYRGPNVCIRPPPPYLNCDDIPFRNFKVVGSDPHGFDGDNDGIGCEGGSRGGSGSGSAGNGNGDSGGSSSSSECKGQADCFRGTVTEIVDGDTLDINNVRVRLALVNTPENGENGYREAIDFVQSVCGVGTTALVDEDDGQKEGSFDRVIGLVYCGNDNINNKKSLNEFLLDGRYAVVYHDFCGISEFSSESWAQRHGC